MVYEIKVNMNSNWVQIRNKPLSKKSQMNKKMPRTHHFITLCIWHPLLNSKKSDRILKN